MSDDSITLNPNDVFERVLIDMVKVSRKKRADYASDNDPLSNFKGSADALGLTGFGPVEAALFNVLQKIERLKALRSNGRMGQTQNESVTDTYLDLAVYAVLTYALHKEQP